jgi:hypothetical protein
VDIRVDNALKVKKKRIETTGAADVPAKRARPVVLDASSA